MSKISQIECKIPLNNFVSRISTSFMKWETRSGKQEVGNEKGERRGTGNGKWEIGNEK